MSKRPQDSVTDWVPEKIGNYRIEKIIGMGGMGAIYRAVQQPLERTVALKVLVPTLYNDEETIARFESEARAVSLLEHQNIIPIYEYGVAEGKYRFIAMQYVDGGSLDGLISPKKYLPFEQLIDYAKQACRGLRYAHAHGVIHRDIKPSNILFDKENVVKLSDFGIAKIFSKSQKITATGMTVGTPEYMSPEQAEDLSVDSRSDIYSFGIVLYEMVTGKLPFTAENAVAVAYKQIHEMPPPPSSRRKDIPKRLELIILKALKKEKAHRYPDVETMLHDLDTVDIDEKVSAPTVSFFSRKKKAAEKKKAEEERRITDRREGDRRLRPTGSYRVWSRPFWIETLRTQWLALVAAGLLAVAFICHCIFQH
jgi:serine/threonine protein kinase